MSIENTLVLSIRQDAQGLHFRLQRGSEGTEAALPVSDPQLERIVDEMNVSMGAPRGLRGPVRTTRVAGDRQVFCRGAASLLPAAIQRYLRQFAEEGAEGEQLILETNLLHIPWELLELPSVPCPACRQPLKALPECPHCPRVLLPDRRGKVECACGNPVPDSQRTRCPCGQEAAIAALAVAPGMHLSLTFALDRVPLDYKDLYNLPGASMSPAGRRLRVLLVENPGDLYVTGQGGEALYYSEQEVAALRRLFRNNSDKITVEILDQGNASLGSLLRTLSAEEPFDIIHFIGHAEFIPDDPMESYLLLSHNKRITLADVGELFGQSVPRLVMLNGCQTGMVQPVHGSLLGFPIAFLKLGCQGFIGTLSKVADPHACYLAIDLYRELIQGATLSDALFAAKRRLAKWVPGRARAGVREETLASLFAWAPFVAYGDANLQLRSFDVDVTWRGLAAAAAEAARRSLLDRDMADTDAEPAVSLDHLSDLIRRNDTPVRVALHADPAAMYASVKQAIASDRHIVCLLELDRLHDAIDLGAYVAHQVLQRKESLDALLPYVQQMSTDESALIVFICGLGSYGRPRHILHQLERLCSTSPGAVKVVLDGDEKTWLGFRALAPPRFFSLVANRDELRERTRGRALAHLRAWAQGLSERELSGIPTAKWARNMPDLYVRRKIEDDIAAFLERSTVDTRGFCVLGETGRGKTNLFCRLYVQLAGSPREGRQRIPLFVTARGLLGETKGPSDIRRYVEDRLIAAVVSDHHTDSSNRQEALEQALQVLREDADGQSIELVVLIDAINEVSEGAGPPMGLFVDGITTWLAAFCEDPVLARGPVYVSALVSSRTFSWRSLWHNHESEHYKYFSDSHRRTDTHGELEENLFDFDLSSEAREAYERAKLKPAWSALDEKFKELCRTPFILHIIRTISQQSGDMAMLGTYDDIMRRYESSVLLVNRSTAMAMQTAGARKAVLDTMVEMLSGHQETEDGRSLPEVVRYETLRRALIEQHYDAHLVHEVIAGLREESVLESHGDRIRFAFDRFFDFLFCNYLIAQSEKWDLTAWHQILMRYSGSEYHRTGASSALARELDRIYHRAGASKVVAILKPLLLDLEKPPPSYRQLVLEALSTFGEEAPDRLADVLQALFDTAGDVLLVSSVACRVIAKPRVAWDKKRLLSDRLGQVINAYLRHSQRGVQRRIEQRDLTNITAGLGRGESGPALVMNLVRSLLGMDSASRQLPEPLATCFDLFIHPQFQRALAKIRRRTLRCFGEKTGRVGILFHLGRAALGTPLMWWFLIRQPRLLKIIPRLGLLFRQLAFILDMLFKGALLWFTERRSVSDAPFREQLTAVETFLFHEVLVTRATATQSADPCYRGRLIDNMAFLIGIVGLWPEINRLFSYSERGLDYLTGELRAGRGPELAELLALLDTQTPLCSVNNAANRLYELFMAPDAFQNYLGMLATIVQGSRDFTQVRDILRQVLKAETEHVIRVGGRTVPQRAKLSREVFSIFTYMVRRAANLKSHQVKDICAFIECVTGYLFAFTPTDREPSIYLQALLHTELFGNQDPFNPLLPLGVACQHRDRQRDRPVVSLVEEGENYITELVDRLSTSELPRRFALIERVLQECVPMAYFAPLLVVGTLQDFIIKDAKLLQKEDSIRQAVTAVIRSLRYVIGGQVARLFDALQDYIASLEPEDGFRAQELSQLVGRIQQDAEGIPLSVQGVEYLYRSIDVFGGHDFITALFIEYDNLRRVTIPHLRQQLLEVKTASELVQGFVARIFKELASPENNFSLIRLFYADDLQKTR